MKKSIDKEALIKNRFWIGLGASVVFALVAFFCVLGVRGNAAQKFGEAKGIDEQLRGIPPLGASLRNQQWIDRMKEETLASERQKDAVWLDGFDKQQDVVREAAPKVPEGAPASDAKPVRGKIREIRKPIITWHEDIRDLTVDVGKFKMFPTKIKDLDFGEKIDIVPNKQFLETYQKQFADLVKLKDLLLLNENNGTGAMRVAGSKTSGANNRPAHDQNLLALLSPWSFTSRPVSSDEAWLLQEDFALKREVLKAIAEANRMVSLCQSEWRVLGVASEEEKEEATATAENAPSKSDAAATPAAASDKPADAAKDKEAGAEATLEAKRFYNTTWHLGANLPPLKDAAGNPARSRIEWYEGWQLNLDLTRKGKEVSLKGTSINLHQHLQTPNTTLAVYLGDASGKELPTPLLIADAGALPPSKLDAQARSFTESKRALKALPAPAEAARILRIQRVATKPAFDEARFFNGDWLVDLKLVPGTGGVGAAVEGVIHNRSGRIALPAQFEITYSDGKDTFAGDATLKQDKGDPFPAHESRPATRFDVRRTTPPKRIVAVRQVLDWRSVPIKQINRIEFGDMAHRESDRTKVRELKAYDFTKKDPTGTGAAPVPAPGAAGADPNAEGGGLKGMGAGGSGAGGGGGAGTHKTEAHGVPLRRYYEVTDEVRRIPVALVLVVDAGNMNDVLAALANSRLRIQITQVVWNRLPSGIGPPTFARRGAPPPAGTPGSGFGGGGLGGTGPGVPSGYPGTPGDSGAKPGGGAGAGIPRGPISVEEETSEIEVQIYGLISEFENPDAIDRIAEMRTKAQAQPVAGGQ